MSLNLCVLLLFAPLVFCDIQQAPNTLVDPDYWDVDEDYYMPANVQYDGFDLTLTKRVAVSNNENFILSPLGIKLVLSLLGEAASGSTQAEITNVLGFEMNRTAVRHKFSTLIRSLESNSSQYILNCGNRIYMDDIAYPRQRFAAIAKEFYHTELKKMSFSCPALVAEDINSWVAKQTDGHILNLVTEDDIAGSMVLILNTLYFKGTWTRPFNPVNTKLGTFHVAPNHEKKVPFMHIEDKFYYTESSNFDAKILRLPYLGNKYAMYILLPNSITGLPRLMHSLSGLHKELENLHEHTVNVALPKFHFDYTVLMNDVLKELGIRQAFDDTASFPGLARGQSLLQRLHVSKVLQRSGIEVNEQGSIAFSASVAGLEDKFGEDTWVVVDKPFFFFIQDETTRQLLFTGRVVEPPLPASH
ncbi:serpin (serine protease inhibitor) domain-containing protein [Phthorimaea operculella]|nr:serpin (serine protease inhibitor) domain-containing protein [Phthorimaea operculella]